MERAKQIMSKNVITIASTATLVEAYQLMHAKNIRHLPVVDEVRAVVGILSDRDLQRAMNVKKLNSFQQHLSLDATLKVEDFMAWPVYMISESATVKVVADQMLTQKVSALLVVNDQGELSGIVTTDDLLKLLRSDEEVRKDLGLRGLGHYFFDRETL